MDLVQIYQEFKAIKSETEDYSCYIKDVAGKVHITPKRDLQELLMNPPPRQAIKEFTDQELKHFFTIDPSKIPVSFY